MGATLLSAAGQAAGQVVATTTSPPEAAVTLRWEPETSSVAIVLPLSVLMEVVMIGIIWAVLFFWVAVKCGCRRGGQAPEQAAAELAGPVEQTEPKTPKKKAPRRVFCEAGVQGPVHYNGVRYIHGTQGFRRADEVTRVVASSGYRVPPGWEGVARPDQREHHE